MKRDDISANDAILSSDAMHTYDVEMVSPEILSERDQRELERCERLIREHERAFCEYARALFTIRDLRLYRAEFPTFEDYCRVTIGKSRKYASRIAQAGEMIERLPEECRVLVSNEHCARKLMNVVPEKRGEVLLQVHQSGAGVTGTAIYRAARKMSALLQVEDSGKPSNPDEIHISRAAATPAVEAVIKKTLERLAGRINRVSKKDKPSGRKSPKPAELKKRLLAAASKLDAPPPVRHAEARRLLLEGVQYLASKYFQGDKREVVLRLRIE